MSISFNIENATPQDGEPLCQTCYWAHMQKGFRDSEEAIFCNFGLLRKVPFKVRECTDYSNKTLPSRDQMEKMALLINVEPARKKAGFKALDTADVLEEEDEIEAAISRR
jgi:hypothetical protein